ncbi:MAG: SAM-dependent chlorinase/fluorinase [Ilumatobacteraceae bacterium]
MARTYDTVSLLTDYGHDDEFAGVLTAVIRDLAPHVSTIDLTHGIRPFDVRGGSLALARSILYVPEGVVVAVVDPGVGTARRAIAVEVAGGAGILVGPDNGLLAPAVAVVGGAERAVELTNPDFHLSAHGATFAGRDVFAPVAAHLCNGVDLIEFGPLVDTGLLMPGMVPLPRDEPDGIHAEVLWVDRFGNCQLNVGPDELAVEIRVWGVTVDGERRVAHVARTFGDLGVGSLGLVVDSQGMFALALDRRSAAEELRLAAGDAVLITAFDDDRGRPAPPTTPVELRRGR